MTCVYIVYRTCKKGWSLNVMKSYFDLVFIVEETNLAGSKKNVLNMHSYISLNDNQQYFSGILVGFPTMH